MSALRCQDRLERRKMLFSLSNALETWESGPELFERYLEATSVREPSLANYRDYEYGLVVGYGRGRTDGRADTRHLMRQRRKRRWA
jgi:hypothetical protein